MSSDSSSPGLRLPGLIHFREGSTPLAVAPKAFGAARQAHASVEYLRRHAGLGQDCSAKQYRLQLHVATHVQSSGTGAGNCETTKPGSTEAPLLPKTEGGAPVACSELLDGVATMLRR